MSRKWADADDDAASPTGKSQQPRLETEVDKDGVKTVIEYVERGGKSFKITKKVRTVTKTHRVNEGIVARRTMTKFLDTLEDAKDVMSKMAQEADEVVIEPRMKRTKDDDMAVESIFGASAKKSVWAKFRGPPAGEDGKPVDPNAPPQPGIPEPKEDGAPGRYVPPSQRGMAGGAGSSLMDLRAQEQKDRDALTLRVTNLSEDVREGDLADLFGQFGRIQRIFLAKNPETKQSKGFAFITFSTKSDAEKAIKRLNGHGYDNLVLRVEFSKPSAPRTETAAPPSAGDFRAALSARAF